MKRKQDQILCNNKLKIIDHNFGEKSILDYSIYLTYLLAIEQE